MKKAVLEDAPHEIRLLEARVCIDYSEKDQVEALKQLRSISHHVSSSPVSGLSNIKVIMSFDVDSFHESFDYSGARQIRAFVRHYKEGKIYVPPYPDLPACYLVYYGKLAKEE